MILHGKISQKAEEKHWATFPEGIKGHMQKAQQICAKTTKK